VRSGLRRPRRLTVLAIVGKAPLAVFYVLRAFVLCTVSDQDAALREIRRVLQARRPAVLP
jgi:hypothetical protein